MDETSPYNKLEIKEGVYKVIIQGDSIVPDVTFDIEYKKGQPGDAGIISFDFIEDTERTENA